MPPQQSGSAGRRLDRSEACGERDSSPACCDYGSCDDPDPRQITKQCASFAVSGRLRNADVHPECTIIICQVRRIQEPLLRRHRLHLAQVFFTMIPTRPSSKKLRLRRISLSVSTSRYSTRCSALCRGVQHTLCILQRAQTQGRPHCLPHSNRVWTVSSKLQSSVPVRRRNVYRSGRIQASRQLPAARNGIERLFSGSGSEWHVLARRWSRAVVLWGVMLCGRCLCGVRMEGCAICCSPGRRR